tara:strand:- start:6 stop:290 length:285 start_codon:yes stop_codon:yes gene_type:complete
MKTFRHVTVGQWPDEKNLCGASRRSWPDRYMSSEKYLHEVKACPKCKELHPELKGFDELLKEGIAKPVQDDSRRVEEQSSGLYLRDYLNKTLTI